MALETDDIELVRDMLKEKEEHLCRLMEETREKTALDFQNSLTWIRSELSTITTRLAELEPKVEQTPEVQPETAETQVEEVEVEEEADHEKTPMVEIPSNKSMFPGGIL